MTEGLGDPPAEGKLIDLSSWKLAAVVNDAWGGIGPDSLERLVGGAGDPVALPLDPPTWIVIFLAPSTGVS